MARLFKTESQFSMIILCGLGIGAYWAWNFTFIASSSNVLMWLTNVACHLFTLALSIPLAKKLAPFAKRTGLAPIVPAFIALGSLTFHSAWLLPDIPYLVPLVSSAVVGVNSAVLFLLWSEAYARFTIVREQEIISYIGVTSGFALYLPFLVLPRTICIILTALLPIASAACITAVNSIAATAIKGARDRGTFSTFRTILPLRLIVCAFIFSIPIGYFKQGFGGNWGVVNTLALLFIVVAVFVEFLYRKKSQDSLVPKMLVLLISGGLLLLPLFAENLAISGTLVVVGSFIFRAYLYQICGIISTYAPNPKTPPFALASCLLDAGWIIGILLRIALPSASPTWSIGATAGIAYLVFAVGLIAFSKRFDYFNPSQAASMPEGPTELNSSIVAEGERLAVRGSLTRREKEVAIMIASGLSVPEVATEMHVSRNTVATHVKHIYQKLNVHSRQELLDLFEN